MHQLDLSSGDEEPRSSLAFSAGLTLFLCGRIGLPYTRKSFGWCFAFRQHFAGSYMRLLLESGKVMCSVGTLHLSAIGTTVSKC